MCFSAALFFCVDKNVQIPPVATDDCSNVTATFLDSLPSSAYASVGGKNFTRIWYLTNECGGVNQTNQTIFISSAGCPPDTPWGADCSCTSPPPSVSAECRGGVWRIVGDITFENTVDLKYDRLEVAGTVVLKGPLSIGFRKRVRPLTTTRDGCVCLCCLLWFC
jgi:hypothetical protein